MPTMRDRNLRQSSRRDRQRASVRGPHSQSLLCLPVLSLSPLGFKTEHFVFALVQGGRLSRPCFACRCGGPLAYSGLEPEMSQDSAMVRAEPHQRMWRKIYRPGFQLNRFSVEPYTCEYRISQHELEKRPKSARVQSTYRRCDVIFR